MLGPCDAHRKRGLLCVGFPCGPALGTSLACLSIGLESVRLQSCPPVSLPVLAVNQNMCGSNGGRVTGFLERLEHGFLEAAWSQSCPPVSLPVPAVDQNTCDSNWGRATGFLERLEHWLSCPPVSFPVLAVRRNTCDPNGG